MSAHAEDQTPTMAPAAWGSDEGQPFVLSRPEWIAVQQYVEEGRSLPQKKADMQVWANLRSDQWLDDFDAVFADPTTKTEGPFAAIARHCVNWKETTFPSSVSLADDIVHYNDKVPEVYQGLLDCLDRIKTASKQLKNETDPAKQSALKNEIDDARQDFDDLLTDLAADATQYAERASGVFADVEVFKVATEGDHTALKRLVQGLDQKHGSNSDQVVAYRQKLKEWHDARDTADAEYRYDVVVASTTPTYAWVPFVGIVAAAVVAGVYGQRAVDALHARQAADDQIAQYNEKIARNEKLLAVLTAALARMKTTQQMLEEALPVIQKIHGGWRAIHEDIDKIKKYMVEDIEKATIVVQAIDVKAAIKRWESVAKKADAYRVNAFITVEGAPPQRRAA